MAGMDGKIERGLTLKYCSLQGTYWLLAAAGMAFITPILQDKGFGAVQIGWLSAVKFLSVIVFQSVLAVYCDRHPGRNRLKAVMGVMALVSIFAAYSLYMVDNSFVKAVFIFIAYGATVNCLSAIVDSLSLQYMNHGRQFFYGASRATGSLCWAFACVGLGIFADHYGNNAILLLQMAVTVIFMMVVILMDPVDYTEEELQAAGQRRKGNRKKMISEDTEPRVQPTAQVHSAGYILIHYPKYTLYLLVCVFLSMGYTLNTTFLVNRFTELGGTTGSYGMGEFVLALSEIPAALFIGKLMKRFSLEKLAFFSGVFCTLRAAAVTFAPTVVTIILGQALEIGGLSIYYVASVYIVKKFLPEGDVVKGVSFINTAMMGVGQSVAAFFSGILLENFGLRGLMDISIVISAISVCFGIAMMKVKE